jgi:hypothetical protein
MMRHAQGGTQGVDPMMVLALGLLLHGEAARAQVERVIPSSPACAGCTVSLMPVVTLGGEDDAPDFTPSSTVTRHGGGYVVAPVGDRSQLAFYGADGRFERTVGRAGAGPGEFGSINGVVPLPDGQLVVLDRRLTMVAADYRPHISRALPASVAAFRMVALPDRRLVLNNYLPGQPPLCFFTAGLELERCFGPVPADARTASSMAQRILTAGPDGTLWAARQMYRYAIEHWDRSGRLLGTIVRDAPWFPSTRAEDDPHVLPNESRPLPRVSGVWLDGAGHLWTSILVPDAHWRATDPRRAGPGEHRTRIPTPGEWSRYLDTIVEVIDLRAGRVVVSQRFPGVLGGFTRDGLLTELVENDEGVLQARVSRPGIRTAAVGRRFR